MLLLWGRSTRVAVQIVVVTDERSVVPLESRFGSRRKLVPRLVETDLLYDAVFAWLFVRCLELLNDFEASLIRTRSTGIDAAIIVTAISAWPHTTRGAVS